MRVLFSIRLLRAIVLSACACGLFPGRALASPEEARRHYEKALALLESDALKEARQEFEEAYAASPHPDVLYNLGMVCLELEDHVAAARYFESFLAQSEADDASDQQRSNARRLLLSMAAQAESDEPARERSDEPRGSNESREEPTEATPNERVPPPQEATHQDVPHSSPSPRPSLSKDERRSLAETEHAGARSQALRSVGLTLSAVGGGLLATSAAILIRNQVLAGQASREREELASSRPPATIAPGDEEGLSEVIDYEAARSQNERTFDSIRQMDIVAGVTGAVGAVVLGTGLSLFLLNKRPVEAEVGPAHLRLRLDF